MLTSIGTTFPNDWMYGPEEIEIFSSVGKQIVNKFPNHRNLLINTTWFGSQFQNESWNKIKTSIDTYDNLFLLAVIDPMYLSIDDLNFIIKKFNIKNIFKIGMFADSEYEWNFHSFVVAKHCPSYSEYDILLKNPKYKYLLYQRKPRPHRIELTNILQAKNLFKYGVVTLGKKNLEGYDWTQGMIGPALTINDDPANYVHNGEHTDFGGIPNDLASLGRLDIWQECFLNVVSETEFDEWNPRFVTEKTWKPIIGLRPFVIHGQREVYNYLRKNGFRTFNKHWPLDIETPDQHGNVVQLIEFLVKKSSEELMQMYKEMLPDLYHNRQRYFEFAKEQKNKVENIFSFNI